MTTILINPIDSSIGSRASLSISSLPIKYLLDFYNQNKEMIYMSPEETGSYSPNMENINQWIENIETHRQYRKTCKERIAEINKKTPSVYTEDESVNLIEKLRNNEFCDDTDHTDVYLAFANAFKNILRYIPFNEMLDKINKIALEINSIERINNYTKIFFFIDDVVKKSNTWIALLLIGELLKTPFFNDQNVLKKSFVVKKSEFIYNTVDSLRENESILVLHIDDMSYSGTQMLHSIDSKYKNPNLHWYITVGYIGDSAIRNFNSSNIKYNLFEATEVIGTFVDLAKDFITTDIMNQLILETKKTTGRTSKRIPNPKLELQIRARTIVRAITDLCLNDPLKTLEKGYGYGEGAFFCRGNQQTLIYFDHKIADTVSTFQKLLITGGWPTSPDNCSDLSLINNCDVKVTSYQGKGCYISANTDIPDHETCPYTFYKRPGFIYQYNSEQINPFKHINDELARIYTGRTITYEDLQEEINELSRLPKPKKIKKMSSKQYMKLLREWSSNKNKKIDKIGELTKLEKINFFDKTWIQKREEFVKNDNMIFDELSSDKISSKKVPRRVKNISKLTVQKAGGSEYEKIINPLTRRKVNITSKLGIIILKKYLKYVNKT